MLGYTKVMSKLFRDLAPYRQSLFSEAEEQGLPLVRHGMLVEPDDPVWFNQSASYEKNGCIGGRSKRDLGNEIGLFQFYLGDDVIVAPALNKDVSQVHVYIPKNAWIHFWTNRSVQGPSYTPWSAPLGQPVFFYRAGSPWAPFFKKLQDRYATQPVENRETIFV